MDDALHIGFSYGGNLPGDYGIRFCQGVLEHDKLVPFTSHRTQATHAFFIRRGQIIEAVPPKVRCIPDDGRTNIRSYRLPDASADAIWSSAERMVGAPYNFAGFPLALGYCLLHKPDWFLRSPLACVFCSELAADAMRSGGIDVLPGIPSVNVTPAHLEWWCWSTLT